MVKYLALLVLLCMPVVTATATTLEEVEKVCAVCGAKSTQVVVMSTNRLGSTDLDLRPPEMMSSTMRYWVLRYELQLIARKGTAAHMVADAPGE